MFSCSVNESRGALLCLVRRTILLSVQESKVTLQASSPSPGGAKVVQRVVEPCCDWWFHFRFHVSCAGGWFEFIRQPSTEIPFRVECRSSASVGQSASGPWEYCIVPEKPSCIMSCSIGSVQARRDNRAAKRLPKQRRRMCASTRCTQL